MKLLPGTIYGSEGGVYRVRLESGEMVDASLRGRVKREERTGDKVVIGDRVGVVDHLDGTFAIEEVDSRDSQVVRRGPGGRKPKVIAANVDRLVVVAAAARPDPRQVLLDRLMVVGESNDLELALVMNKIDLDEGKARALSELYRTVGYQVLEASAVTGEGLGSVEELLSKGTSALVGPSGVGKSTLLNAIQPDLGLRTGELSHKEGRGRHTTVSARLIPLRSGGLVADTPGFSDVGVWGVDQRTLESCFPDFHPYREECQFRGCSHLHEPNCGVQTALARNQIDEGRYVSYRVLVGEAGGF